MCSAFCSFHYQFNLPVFLSDRHRLRAHPPDHIERRLPLAVQRQVLHILCDGLLDLGPHGILDLEEPVRRA
jgi:hypothetical protein